MTDWYSADKGQQRGPIPESDLMLMFANRLLPLETRVWTATFGNEWRLASQTPLVRLSGSMPPPLAATPASAVLRCLSARSRSRRATRRPTGAVARIISLKGLSRARATPLRSLH
ncbi:DUF4339 domain-containing protein [Aminobacter ciceronei]|uniref:GYF domain-containing protein n=1 Tax=Aminobacter ciceronei TaxID=150723 RepID=A0ABR6CIS7_9HYPH|nr:DUF4339 domain-containing protein [Aminobacter ciceronei]MBA8910697.1 hypothetical protein [Aminobacter ciceronei]MBA9024465.1 hypothetical protein [Aminobacter ciceronei]